MEARPPTRVSRILGLLAAEPDRQWRPIEVANELGESGQLVASALLQLYAEDRVERKPRRINGNMRTHKSTYSHKEPPNGDDTGTTGARARANA